MVRKAYLEAETVVEGQTSNFYCDVTSPSQPVINWIKDLQPDKASGPQDNDVVISDFCLHINVREGQTSCEKILVLQYLFINKNIKEGVYTTTYSMSFLTSLYLFK